MDISLPYIVYLSAQEGKWVTLSDGRRILIKQVDVMESVDKELGNPTKFSGFKEYYGDIKPPKNKKLHFDVENYNPVFNDSGTMTYKTAIGMAKDRNIRNPVIVPKFHYRPENAQFYAPANYVHSYEVYGE